MRQHKGHTLVELLIIMGMMITVITVAYSSGLVNLKILNKINNQTIVQQQVETGMNTIVKSIMGAVRVSKIDVDITDDEEHPIKCIILKMVGGNYLEIELDDQTLKIGKANKVDEISPRPFAYGVDRLSIALIGSDSYEDQDYSDCKGLEIKIEVMEKDTVITLKNEAYFRNWNTEE